MKFKNLEFTFAQLFFLGIYKLVLVHLPASTFPFVGKFCKYMRYHCCKYIFKEIGENVNIEHGADFGSGFNLKIGDNSGIGIDCKVPGDINIGKNVMMGPNCFILNTNHRFDRVDIPMIQQGVTERSYCVIEDDVWIGRQVIFTPGRIVKKGSIIGAGTVLTKNFPEYSIVAGNPARLIKSRIEA